MMIEKSIDNYYKFSRKTYNSASLLYMSFERKEAVLSLQNPQLVYALETLNKNSLKSNLESSSNFTTGLESETSNNFVNRFDKKSKSNIRSTDSLESKKNKLKQKKKTRTKIHLDDEEEVFSGQMNAFTSSNDALAISVMRPPKPVKYKQNTSPKQDKSNTSHKTRTKQKHKRDTKVQDPLTTREVFFDNPLSIQDLSTQLQIPEAEIITWLFMQGISVTMNQVVDISIASSVAEHYNFTIQDSLPVNSQDIDVPNSLQDNSECINRAPIVAIFGHVDHGKTTLLDAIRSTNIASREIGGITQAIGAYEVEFEYLSKLEKIILLDTPGHEAFSGMRLRGANVADLAILVVAADDGLKPQTIEAINYIQEKKIPFVVAINKIDKVGTDVKKLKEQLSQHGIIGEDWGGNALIIEVSALQQINIDNLLSNLLILSELGDFKANPNQLATGTILEAHLDKKIGPRASILIQNGTLTVGDIIVSDNLYGKIKALVNSSGMRMHTSGPSSVVEVCGFSSVPNAGSVFSVTKNEKEAKSIIASSSLNNKLPNLHKVLNSRVTLESYKAEITPKYVNLILKTDSQGSIEAIIDSFAQIPQEKVQLNLLAASSGEVSDRDIELASTSQSVILTFNLNISSNVKNAANRANVLVMEFKIIYDLLDYIKTYMLDLVEPEYLKVEIGEATVETVFSINKGAVAGCSVNSGKLKKDAYISVYREGNIVYDGILESLKRVKEDVLEISSGNECGVMCSSYHLWHKQDVIKSYELVPKEKSL